MMLDLWHSAAVHNERASPNCCRFIGNYRRVAERFLYTDETTAMAAKLVSERPDMLVRNYQFALPPYPTCYVEYNSRAWVEAFGADKYASGEAEGSDFNVGHFMHDGAVATVVDTQNTEERNIPDLKVGVCPWLYTTDGRDYHTRGMRKVRIEGDFKDQLDAHVRLLLGTTGRHPRSGITQEIKEDLDRRVQLYVERTVKDRHFADMLSSFIGEVRTLWTLLLFLNQPSHVHFDDIPASRRMVGNRSIAIPRARLVRIKPKTTVHHICRTMRERMKPGRHKVRDTWRNFEKDQRCIHDWPLEPDEHGIFQCRRCEQWRVRVRAHERGDPTRPVIRRGYQV